MADTTGVAHSIDVVNGAVIMVPFHGGHIEATRDERGIWVPLDHACECVEVNYQSQYTKVKQAEWANFAMIAIVAEDGKIRQRWCLHVDSLPMWLATINPKKVRPELRPKLVAYQREAAQVLRDYFLGGGVAVNPRLSPEQAVSAFVTKQQEIALAKAQAELDAVVAKSKAELEEFRSRSAELIKREVLETKKVEYEFLAKYLPKELLEKRLATEVACVTGIHVEDADPKIEVEIWLRQQGLSSTEARDSRQRFGAIAAAVYLQRRGRKPEKAPKIVGNTSVHVNVYYKRDEDVLFEAFRQMFPMRPMLVHSI